MAALGTFYSGTFYALLMGHFFTTFCTDTKTTCTKCTALITATASATAHSLATCQDFCYFQNRSSFISFLFSLFNGVYIFYKIMGKYLPHYSDPHSGQSSMFLLDGLNLLITAILASAKCILEFNVPAFDN